MTPDRYRFVEPPAQSVTRLADPDRYTVISVSASP